jgi:GntR family transcriptional repressor for pyruvate dehydrogenase complex
METERQTFQSIKRNAVVEDIVEAVRQSLIDGTLSPGQRLPTESELGEQFGVGRNAVREAMKMLSALGAVEVRRGDGTYIVDEPSSTILNPLIFAVLLKTRTTKELYELRLITEVGYCLLAAENATCEDMEIIQTAALDWEAYALSPQPDINRLTQLDLTFHFAILDATHNSLVVTIGRMVEELFLTSIRDALSNKTVPEGGVVGHRRILAALQSRDRDCIHEAVASSLENWGEKLEEKVSSRSDRLVR